MQIRIVPNWPLLVKIARERGVETLGEYIVMLALQGCNPGAEGMKEIRKAYEQPTVIQPAHSAN